MSTEFHVSYTLDALLYIKCMIDEEKRNLYDEDIGRFLPMLGTVSDEYLEKLKKINKKNPKFIDHMVSLLIVNDHLHDWTTTDLLDRHKRLVVMFKKSEHTASKDLKKFIKKDFSKTIPLIKTIASDLERLGFKKFWLEEKLPALKERSAENQLLLSEFNIARHVNGWLEKQNIPDGGDWYMLAYNGNEYKILLNDFNVTSPITPSDELFDTIVAYALNATSYRSYCKSLKPTTSLKAELKGHKNYKSYKKISYYADACLKMALKIYLREGYNKTDKTIADDYPFATDLLNYLRSDEKSANETIGHYITNMMKYFSR